jgi:recombination protein RecA
MSHSKAAAALSKPDLEALLRARKLDHTVNPLLPPAVNGDDVVRSMVPTGIVELDARLYGGFPRGHLSECVGPRSSGRLALIVSAMARATERGEAVALVDPLDMFDPPSAAASGIDFRRMLWVRGQALSSARVSLSCEYGTLQKSLDASVKALNLVLQAGGFGLVVLDLVEIAPQALRRLPFTTWLRLQRVIEGSETACVLMGSEPIARSAGGVTLRVEGGRGETRARVIHARRKELNTDVCVPLSAAC